MDRYFREIRQWDLLSAEEEVRLSSQVRKGNPLARETMISSNLRLVVKLAQQYQGKGLPLADLVSEGNIGLMRAVDKFDPAYGTRFSTYAAFWIKQAIRRSLSSHSRIVRIPIGTIEHLLKLLRIEDLLERDLGRKPAIEETARHMGISEERVAFLRGAERQVVSIDAPINGEEKLNLLNQLSDEQSQSPPFVSAHISKHTTVDLHTRT